MTEEEAIEHIGNCMSGSKKMLFPEVWEAHKLGMEALQYVMKDRRDTKLREKIADLKIAARERDELWELYDKIIKALLERLRREDE